MLLVILSGQFDCQKILLFGEIVKSYGHFKNPTLLRILVTIEIIVLTRMFWQKIDLRPVQFPAGQTEKNKGSIIIITQHIIVVLTHASAKLYTFQSFLWDTDYRCTFLTDHQNCQIDFLSKTSTYQ